MATAKKAVTAKATKEEKKVAVVEPSELSLASQEAIEALRKGSGENNGGAAYEHVPTITVDGKKEEAEVNGRKVQVTCAPKFLVTTVDQNKEYVSEPFAVEFPAVILRTRYQIKKKWKQGDSTPFFFSAEFDAFDDEINLISNKKSCWKGGYKQLKIDFAEGFDLYAVIYVYSAEADKIYRCEFKGVSRSQYWDYLKTFPRNDSVSAYITNFKAVTQTNEAGLDFNAATFERVGVSSDLQTVLIKQREMNNALNARETANSSRDNIQKEDEIVVPEVVFK